MADNLRVFGNTYNNAVGVKLTDTNGNEVVYTAGGGSNWTLIGSTTLTVNTTSTSASSAGTVQCGSEAWTSTAAIWVHIRGKSGKRSGYFYGSDTIFLNSKPFVGSTEDFTGGAVACIQSPSETGFGVFAQSYGVYGYSISSSGTVTIRKRYSSTYSLTINDQFDVEVYKLELPTDMTLFNQDV